jgi:hypothetical protein
LVNESADHGQPDQFESSTNQSVGGSNSNNKVHTGLVPYVEEEGSPLRCMIRAIGPLASISSLLQQALI